jgi:hypothetical protein
MSFTGWMMLENRLAQYSPRAELGIDGTNPTRGAIRLIRRSATVHEDVALQRRRPARAKAETRSYLDPRFRFVIAAFNQLGIFSPPFFLLPFYNDSRQRTRWASFSTLYSRKAIHQACQVCLFAVVPGKTMN